MGKQNKCKIKIMNKMNFKHKILSNLKNNKPKI
jgi:hypothetical protein